MATIAQIKELCDGFLVTIVSDPAATTETPSRTRDEAERAAWEPFLELMRQEKRRISATCQDLGLTSQQAYALLHLSREGPSSMVSLAETMQCDASNITGLVDKLEARGLIERRPHPQDRRVKLLVVTAAGDAMHRALRERMAKPPAHFAALSVKDLKALHKILRRASAAVPREPTVQ